MKDFARKLVEAMGKDTPLTRLVLRLLLSAWVAVGLVGGIGIGLGLLYLLAQLL